MSIKRRIKTAILTLILLVVSIIFISGCVSKEEPAQKKRLFISQKIFEEVPLKDILYETTEALSLDLDMTEDDPYLISLKEMRPKEVGKKGGPLKALIAYPPNLSLIDKATQIRVTITHNDGPVDSVEFYMDGKLVHTAKTEPYEWTFDPQATTKARHKIKIVAKSGTYSTSDEITLFNVVVGSIVILPWKPSGGNIPYSRVDSYYPPDGASIEAAFFTAYGENNFYVDYSVSLPGGLSYMYGVLSPSGEVLASKEGTTTGLEFKFWDWSTSAFSKKPFSAIGGGEMTEPEYEALSFKDPGDFSGRTISGLPFYAFEPFTKKVRVRVSGAGPLKFYLYPMELKYYGIYDAEKPILRAQRAVRDDSGGSVEIFLNEPCFVEVYCYDSNRQWLTGSRYAKPEGWNEVKVVRPGTSFVKIKAVDCSGNSTITDFIRLN